MGRITNSCLSWSASFRLFGTSLDSALSLVVTVSERVVVAVLRPILHPKDIRMTIPSPGHPSRRLQGRITDVVLETMGLGLFDETSVERRGQPTPLGDA